jgi:WD40 repeat protein
MLIYPVQEDHPKRKRSISSDSPPRADPPTRIKIDSPPESAPDEEKPEELAALEAIDYFDDDESESLSESELSDNDSVFAIEDVNHPACTYLVTHDQHTQTAYCSNDGLLIASASRNGNIRLWDVMTGTCLHLHHFDKPAITTRFSPCGDLFVVALGGSGDNVVIFDLVTRLPLRSMGGHRDGVYSACFSPCGRMIATGGMDMTARFFDVASGQQLQVYSVPGHTFHVVFSPDSKFGFAACSDGGVHVFDLQRGLQVAVIRDHASFVFGVNFSADGRLFASTSGDGQILLYDAATMSLRMRLQSSLPPTHLFCVAFSPDSRLIVASGSDGVVRAFDVGSGSELAPATLHGDEMYSVGFLPDGSASIGASADGRVSIMPVPAAYVPPALLPDDAGDRLNWRRTFLRTAHQMRNTMPPSPAVVPGAQQPQAGPRASLCQRSRSSGDGELSSASSPSLPPPPPSVLQGRDPS